MFVLSEYFSWEYQKVIDVAYAANFVRFVLKNQMRSDVIEKSATRPSENAVQRLA